MRNPKVLLVYYSRTGTTRVVAEAIAAALACDVEEIQTRGTARASSDTCEPDSTPPSVG